MPAWGSFGWVWEFWRDELQQSWGWNLHSGDQKPHPGSAQPGLSRGAGRGDHWATKVSNVPRYFLFHTQGKSTISHLRAVRLLNLRIKWKVKRYLKPQMIQNNFFFRILINSFEILPFDVAWLKLWIAGSGKRRLSEGVLLNPLSIQQDSSCLNLGSNLSAESSTVRPW